MQFSVNYPLTDDIGFPDGLNNARRKWVAVARKQRLMARSASVLTAIAVIAFFTLLGLAPWLARRASQPHRLKQQLASNMPHGNAHLGAEYYNIARAVAEGRGFSDPFVVESGPTAWMPPLLVWLQSGLIYACGGDRFWVMVIVVILKSIVLACCATAVIVQSWRVKHGWLAFSVLTFFLFAEFFACFSFTHDGWIILAGITSTLFGLVWLDRRLAAGPLSIATAVGWGILGGLVAYSSPVAGFTWAVGTTVCLARSATMCWLVAALTSVLVITPWAIRNQLVLGKFVPMKSNVYFEFDQSQVLDSDGLLDWETMSAHPYHAGPEQDAYVEMGEIDYLQTKQERFLNSVKSNPGMFAQKVKNRLIGATIWPAGFSGFMNPLRWLIYPWPAFAVIYLLIWGRPLSRLQRYTILIYAAYLTPYVVCSYYPRYGFPLFAVKVLLTYWLLDQVRRRIQTV